MMAMNLTRVRKKGVFYFFVKILLPYIWTKRSEVKTIWRIHVTVNLCLTNQEEQARPNGLVCSSKIGHGNSICLIHENFNRTGNM